MKGGRRRGARSLWVVGALALAICCMVKWHQADPAPTLPMAPAQRELLEMYWQAHRRESAEADASLRPAGRSNAAATTTLTAAPVTRKRGRSAARKTSVPSLTKDLAWKHAKAGLLYVTWTNFHSSDFAVNWAASLEAAGVSNYLVGALDAQAATALAAAGVPAFIMFDRGANGTGLPLHEFAWGSPAFHAMGRQKVALAVEITGFGLDIFLCDADTAFLSDPTDFFAAHPAADILASSDNFQTTQPPGDAGLEAPTAVQEHVNIGMVFFRHSDAMAAFMSAWAAALEADDKLWDQHAFNYLLHRGEMGYHPDHERLTLGFDRSLAVGVLPVSTFATGHTFFVQKMYERQGVQPIVVHATYSDGLAAKRHRLREAGLWRDPDDYYSGRFLAVEVTKPVVPKGFHTWSSSRMALFHLQAVATQLAEVRDAIGIAASLGRALVLPKLHCFCDKYWDGMNRCRAENSTFDLPFECPIDHVMKIDALAWEDMPGTVYVPFKESTFLDNPRTRLRGGAGEVEVEAVPGATAVTQGRGPRGQLRYSLPEGLSDYELMDNLREVEDTPVLRVLGSPSALFARAKEAAAGQALATRFLRSLDRWCCQRSVVENTDAVTEEQQPFYYSAAFLPDGQLRPDPLEQLVWADPMK